ncbi:hypothetical protein K0504_11220 [Neiella marina]|uniref:Uncharacterized protein n=1 Tax=Neiella holothuriorum TaxID=2870530 RepID=A0ABS7EH00_9GAMM|nr:hypothetical protein [Neiella holothuriorum]MBW8191608.1 hypothetical protein [Neiella holothuriorum]
MSDSPIKQIFDYARWAPSGDNVQNWQFEFVNDLEAIIHGHDESDWLVYDKKGNASKLALGCLLETLEIAALQQGFSTQIELVENRFGKQPTDEAYSSHPTFKVNLSASEPAVQPLFSSIKTRTVQRKLMSRSGLSPLDKQALEQSLPTGYSVIWLDSVDDKKQIAKLMYGNATTRYLMREGYDTHSRIIEFTAKKNDGSPNQLANSEFSKNKIPAKALGLDPLTVIMMEWVLASWDRFHFVATYLAGTVWPKLIMDYMTAICCGTHFVIIAEQEPKTLEDYVNAGRAVQRFWLQSDIVQLGFQPEQTPIIFSEYIRDGVSFTTDVKANTNAQKMDTELKQMLGVDTVNRAVFMGRLGHSNPVQYRSVRKSLEELEIK